MAEGLFQSAGVWPVLAVASLVALVIALLVLVAQHRRHGRDSTTVHQHLDIAAQATGIGLWSLDLRTGRLTWDERMFALYGRDSSDFAGAYEVWRDSLHPEDVDEAEAAYRRAVEGPADFDTRFRIVRPDGTIRHIRAFGQVLLDEKGRPTRMAGTNTDVTEQAVMAQRLTRLAATVPGIVFQVLKDADGRLTMPVFNGSLKDDLGLDVERLADDASALFERIHPDDRDGLRQSLEDSARDMTVWTREVQWTDSDGQARWLELRATPERLLDGALLWHGFLTEITQRRAAERQRDALAAVVEASDDIIVIKDLSLRVVATNPAFAAASGKESVEALIGRTDAEIFGLPEDQDPIKTYMADERRAQTLPKGEAVTREEPVIRADGSVGYVLTRKYPIHDRRGALIGTGNISVDITDRRAVEAALARSERRFRDIAETLSDWIWEVDTEGRYTHVAGNVQDGLGLSPDEMIGRTIFEFIVDPEPAALRAMMDQAVAHGTPIRDLENWNRTVDGRLVCMLTNGIPIRDDDGTVIGYRGTDKDITDRKAAEDKARITHERYIESQYIGRVGHWRRDLRSADVTWSEGVFKIFGLDPAAFATDYDRIIDLIDPRDRSVVTDALQRIAETGQPETYHFRFRRGDEQRIIWTQGYRETGADGTPIAVFGVVRDVTEEQSRLDALEEERRRAMDLMQLAQTASLAKSSFLATMSHELRTPLNAIIGFTEMMALETLGPMPRVYGEYADHVLESARFLLSLIDDILDLARVESGRRDIVVEEISVSEEIDASLRTIGLKAEEQGLSLRTEIAPDARTLVADPRAVRQVLLNLLSNAIKFTPRGGHVTLRADGEADGAVRLTVEDTGIGIPAEDHERVFEAFSRTRDADERAIQGTGLGLTLVKALMDLHGGEVSLMAKPGQGTTVSVVFPRQDA
jgi:PAS domain S-box-containing protein